MANRTKLTAENKKRFTEALVETGGNVTAAAKAINVRRETAYWHRNNDPLFALAWDDAVEAGTAALEQEAYRRAFGGTKKPVYQAGKLVGHIKEYSDTLTIFLLKARRPEVYRERYDVRHGGELTVKTQPEDLTDDQLAEIAASGNGRHN